MDAREAMDAFCKSYAKENNVTVEEAARMFKEKFDRKDEWQMPKIIDSRPAGEPGEMIAIEAERAKTERLRMEMEQKRLDAEQKRLDAEAKKQEYLDKKLEMEEKQHQEELKYQRERDEADRKYQRQKDDAAANIREQQATTERLILLSNLSSGKKGAPDEMMEYLKSQSESTKEFYKAQGESTKGMYEILLNAKNSERDREFEWKKELAKIEADREVELEKLRATTDSETSSSTAFLVNTLGEKLDRFAEQNQKVNNADDFVAKMDEYNKMQDTVIKSSLGILKARGFSEEQLEVVKSAVTSEEDRQKGTLDKLWQVGKAVWKQIEPQIAASPNAEQALAMQCHAAEQQRLAREREESMRKQVEEEACRLTAENTVLEQEKARLKQIEETNRALQQRYLDQRNTLAGKAVELGIMLNDQMTNEQIFTAIEQREAEVERRQQKEYENQQVRERKERERKEAPEIVEQQPEPDQDIIKESADNEGPLELQPEPEPEKQAAPKRAHKRSKGGKDMQQFTIYKEDGTEIFQVESVTHKSAGLKVANTLNGTPENPVRIKITDESGEQKQFDAYSAMVENNAGTKYPVPRVRAVQ